MTALDQPGLRVLVGAASFADAAEAMRIIDRLPASFYSNLGGLLIEELDTLAVCQLPDQRIISQSGVATLAPTLSHIRCLIAADARAFKLSLACAAELQSTRWAFEQGQGDLVAKSLRAARGWDVLIIGHRKAHKINGSIILLEGPEPSTNEIGMTAQKLSQTFGKKPIIFAINGGTNDAVGLRNFSGLDDSLATLARTNALAVLVDLKNGPIRNEDDLVRLLEAARCPIIVFGAAGAPP